MAYRKHASSWITLFLSFILLFPAGCSVAESAPFVYEHDPRQNPAAMRDIVVNPDAVYGFSPRPDGDSTLKEYVDAIDWTNPAQVALARQQRQAYHDNMQELYAMILTMAEQDEDIEAMARAVSRRRNEIRLESYGDDLDGLAAVKKRNLDLYGDEFGPTPESLYEKYGSWDTVLYKALKTNAGMDACTGFYDEMYYLYDLVQDPDVAAEKKPLPEGPVIGIAWRADTDSEFFTNICRAIEEAGGSWVMLDQVFLPDLANTPEGMLLEGVAKTGALDESAAKLIRCNTWHESNAAEAVGTVRAVIFTDGEDISPTLYYTPEAWHGIEDERDYNAERDVSDYLTMSYCLDNDIPVIGFCRGMQMLAVISGAEVIQDIPTFFESQGLEYHYEHRNQKATPDSYRDYAPHTVHLEKGSIAWDIFGRETLDGCPSWHHQAIKNVDDTRLVVTGYTEVSGIKMIEVVERTDKTLAIGFQFHPEAVVAKHLDNAANKGDYMDYDTALSLFTWLVQQISEPAENAA